MVDVRNVFFYFLHCIFINFAIVWECAPSLLSSKCIKREEDFIPKEPSLEKSNEEKEEVSFQNGISFFQPIQGTKVALKRNENFDPSVS